MLRNNDMRIPKSLFSIVKLLYVYKSRKHRLRYLGDEPRWSKRCWLCHALGGSGMHSEEWAECEPRLWWSCVVWHNPGSEAWEFELTFGQAVFTIFSHFSWPPHSIQLCDPFWVYDPQFMRLCFRLFRKGPLDLWPRQNVLEEATLGSCMSWWAPGSQPWASWLVPSFSC